MRLALALVAALALGGCGGSSGGGSPEETLAETAEKLGEIRSGDMTLELEIASERARAGFRLAGPFAYAESEDALPVAELEYTQIAGANEATTTFVSTGDRAWVVSQGQAQELPDEALADLRGVGAGSGGGGGGGLEELRIEDWFVEPEMSDGGDVGGAETDHVESELDVVAAANDLSELVRSFGGNASALEGTSAEQLRRAVESATVEVWTGKDDRLLRRLLVDVEFEAEPPEELESLYESLPGATFHLELAVAEPNREIEVDAPEAP